MIIAFIFPECYVLGGLFMITNFAKFSDSHSIPDLQLQEECLLQEAAKIAIEVSLNVKRGEKILIISNPERDSAAISKLLYDAGINAGGCPVLIFQPRKTQFDFAEAAVISALGARPDVIISLSADKMGKDPHGIAHPYELNGNKYDHIFHLLLYGEKCSRAFWSPSVTIDSFIRTLPIDYSELRRRCNAIKDVLDRASSVHVTAPGGTDITIGLKNRIAKSDDGNFTLSGTGGNLPAGETFISPANGTAHGCICFDGSISTSDGDFIISKPIVCYVKNGFITDISGGNEADVLLNTIKTAEYNAIEFERLGKLSAGMGDMYARNARNIGELGIGLNPKAVISGNMLEDEKAFHTCHFAIGSNYDNDAPAFIHLDGLVNCPTITALMPDGSEVLIDCS
jgi:leucyl aminopeptidase (aminopeptidase T)